MTVSAPRLVCLGQFTVDDVYLPDGSVTPECTGGDALYASLAARLWMPAVQMVAPVGYDLPEQTLATLHRTGLATDGLVSRQVETIRNCVYYDANGGRRWEVFSSDEAFDILSPRPEDLPKQYRQAQAFLISAMSLPAQEELVSWLRENTTALIALDTKEDYIAGNEERLWALIARLDIFLPSTAEVVQLVGHEDWALAAQMFSASGPHTVVIKRGADGSLVYDGRSYSWFNQPALPLEVVDATGAGDAFCGGFLAGYIKDSSDLRRAARMGAISSSYAIADFGMDGLLAADQVKARVRLAHGNG